VSRRRHAGTRGKNETRTEESGLIEVIEKGDEIGSCHDLNYHGKTAKYSTCGDPCCQINGKIR